MKKCISKVIILLLYFTAFICSVAHTVNYGHLRKLPITMVVIHSTGGPTCKNSLPVWIKGGNLEEDFRTIEDHPTLGVHYMIGRDGTVLSSVPENRVAHHVFSYSQQSIGIELVNDGDGIDAFSERQVDSLVLLLQKIVKRYNITPEGIKRHSDVDQGMMPCAPIYRRKVDPGAAFPFQEVIHRVFQYF